MNPSSPPTRRAFLAVTTLTPVAALLARAADPAAATAPARAPANPLGVASYSFRKLTLAQALAGARRVGLTHICLKSFHLPLESAPDACAQVARQARDAGLDLYAGGAITMKTAADVPPAFAYAKAAGMRLIVGVPAPDVLDLVERHTREFDIAVAIHNHGPGDTIYPTPQAAYDRIKNRDRRLGLCIDIGHTARLGADPVQAIRACGDRLLDIHLKDVSAPQPGGQELEIGRGIIDIPGVLRALRAVRYTGVLSFEYEKDPGDPIPGLAESVGYVRGVLASLAEKN